jgi:HPt (histidine-containing phosphotransfer) domain-containing protein
MNVAREELALTVHEIKQLEQSLADTPDVDTAIRLRGYYDVAERLVEKVAEEERLAQAAEEERQTAALRDRYDTLVENVEREYAEAAKALRIAIDTLEQAYNTKTELRRAWNMLDKRGARPDRMPDSFWPRDPQLRNDFVDSVLRNGEP